MPDSRQHIGVKGIIADIMGGAASDVFAKLAGICHLHAAA